MFKSPGYFDLFAIVVIICVVIFLGWGIYAKPYPKVMGFTYKMAEIPPVPKCPTAADLTYTASLVLEYTRPGQLVRDGLNAIAFNSLVNAQYHICHGGR